MDAIGFDSYNLCLTGRAAMSIKATRSDPEHLPCVVESKVFANRRREPFSTAVAYTVDMGGGKSSACTYEDQSPTLTCTHYGEPAVAYTLKIRGGARHTKPGAERLRKQGKDR